MAGLQVCRIGSPAGLDPKRLVRPWRVEAGLVLIRGLNMCVVDSEKKRSKVVALQTTLTGQHTSISSLKVSEMCENVIMNERWLVGN